MKRATNTINYRIIRPFGYSNLPQAPKISKSDSKLPVLFDHPFTRGFLAKIVAAGIKHKTLPHSYGGPTSLAQYKCFISVPYQTSTMKDYENLAHGVVMLVPTPRYLRELMDDPTLTMGNLFSLLNVGDDWYKYIEQYTDEMKDWFYQFDSIDDLKNILKRDVIDTRNVRQRAPEWWESKTKKAIEDWKEVFKI